MEKYIKINTPIQYQGGWSSSATMLNINSYTITKNVIVNQSSTAPMAFHPSGSTLSVNYSLYKDYAAYNNNEAAAQPKIFMWSISKQIETDLVEDIFDVVLTELTSKEFDCEIVTNY